MALGAKLKHWVLILSVTGRYLDSFKERSKMIYFEGQQMPSKPEKESVENLRGQRPWTAAQLLHSWLSGPLIRLWNSLTSNNHHDSKPQRGSQKRPRGSSQH